MDKRERLENFMTKAKLLGEDTFTVDLGNLALVKCKPGEYDITNTLEKAHFALFQLVGH